MSGKSGKGAGKYKGEPVRGKGNDWRKWELAMAADVARGFGDRANMLESLFFAAVDHQRMDAVLDALLDKIATWERATAEIGEGGLPVQPWLERLDGTRAMVRRMRVEI